MQNNSVFNPTQQQQQVPQQPPVQQVQVPQQQQIVRQRQVKVEGYPDFADEQQQSYPTFSPYPPFPNQYPHFSQQQPAYVGYPQQTQQQQAPKPEKPTATAYPSNSGGFSCSKFLIILLLLGFITCLSYVGYQQHLFYREHKDTSTNTYHTLQSSADKHDTSLAQVLAFLSEQNNHFEQLKSEVKQYMNQVTDAIKRMEQQVSDQTVALQKHQKDTPADIQHVLEALMTEQPKKKKQRAQVVADEPLFDSEHQHNDLGNFIQDMVASQKPKKNNNKPKQATNESEEALLQQVLAQQKMVKKERAELEAELVKQQQKEAKKLQKQQEQAELAKLQQQQQQNEAAAKKQQEKVQPTPSENAKKAKKKTEKEWLDSFKHILGKDVADEKQLLELLSKEERKSKDKGKNKKDDGDAFWKNLRDQMKESGKKAKNKKAEEPVPEQPATGEHIEEHNHGEHEEGEHVAEEHHEAPADHSGEQQHKEEAHPEQAAQTSEPQQQQDQITVEKH